MKEIPAECAYMELYPTGTYELSGFVKSALDQEIACLPKGEASEQETRYPTDAASMRAFLEVFFTRHLFQVQNSLLDYVISADFHQAIRSGPLRILDIGSGPAVASLALMDIVDRVRNGADSHIQQGCGLPRMTHVLNDTSAICLVTGRRMVTACVQRKNQLHPAASRHQVFTLSSAFPGNVCQIRHLASFGGGFDLTILSYVLRPLTEDGNLQGFVSGLNTLERFCKPGGRVLIIQDRFQEPLVRKVAGMIGVECREQTLTQEIYPPRGNNEIGAYTYYDCLYMPRGGTCPREAVG